MSEAAEITRLERALAAKEKTIAVLIHRVEDRMADRGSVFAVLEQNLAFEQVVSRKTKELQQEHEALQLALKELGSAQTKLLQAQKMESIGQLAAGIAHEINTPIQYVSDNTQFVQKAVKGLLELVDLGIASAGPDQADSLKAKAKALKLDFLRVQVPRAIEQSIEGVHRVTTIVGAMKDFSHPSADRHEAIDIRDCINTTIVVASNEWKYVAEVERNFDERLPPVPCLRDQLNQVLLNLIVNAAHAIADVVRGTDQKGKITISTSLAGEYAEIRISDTGGGIPEAIRSRVFDPFFTTKPVGKGTGQGLAIAYAVMVERHGGKIDFESEVGKGTTFILRLPLQGRIEGGE